MDKFINWSLGSYKMKFIEQIENNNKTHLVTAAELDQLLETANQVYTQHFSAEVRFERSIFINWTCAIADCKYCFLSTKPRYNPQKEGKKPLRSKESILGEVLLCKALGWEVGYITGGLRVESTNYLIDLASKIEIVLGKKVMMNFGPYVRPAIEKFRPYVIGMGAAIESFDEELHNFICPSKPLKSLMNFLGYLQECRLEKLITIILGLGERKEDVFTVVTNIQKYGIEKVQLCFLKAQKNTLFTEVPAPNIEYMAWWVAQLRIACPTLQIKVALVPERIKDFSLLLKAGANSFSRFMVFHYFGTGLAAQLEEECQKVGRTLQGQFTTLPPVNFEAMVSSMPLDEPLKKKIVNKAEQYYRKLGRAALHEEDEE